ncbi:inorganic phosphate transporter [Solitalea koreensis]|uniref:Inorganic phosphate transporter, PiT family n=1 Tax=Solitalea koreensis TaxID=543615 RepID=A0A521E544_9SPHI|nr:inorganic phosphate transporter [Solitalea koreensis]SMO78481.1 inorganic phosphate transporter, PiT family [Solitalea koreensis]
MTLLIIIIILAFAFDFINGFHDAANSIATIVSTKVLTPLQAVLWAAFFNFMAYLIFELHVADSIAKIVRTDAISLEVIFAGLCAAIIWNLLTWWLGIPSSSSHTLVGGFAGAAVAHAGFAVVNSAPIIKIIAFIFLAPVLGMVISYFLSVILLHLSKNGHPNKLDKQFKGFQLISSALFSLGHGGNDAQKVMGIIAAALMVFYKGVDPSVVPHWAQIQLVGGKIHHIPIWVSLGCYTAIAAGTLSGGWRIVKTMGSKITKITPFEGVAAETAGALLLFGTEKFGIPVSTTHTITGAIMGVGLTKRISAVRWGITRSLLWAWVLTIPVSGALAALFYWILKLAHFAM